MPKMAGMRKWRAVPSCTPTTIAEPGHCQREPDTLYRRGLRKDRDGDHGGKRQCRPADGHSGRRRRQSEAAAAQDFERVLGEAFPQRGQVAVHPGRSEVLCRQHANLVTRRLRSEGERPVLANCRGHRGMSAQVEIDLPPDQHELAVGAGRRTAWAAAAARSLAQAMISSPAGKISRSQKLPSSWNG